MKLNDQELHGLRDMIVKTSSKVINKYIELNKVGHEADILFMGDSMIEYLDVKSSFTGFSVLNRGVAGSTTKLILDNFSNVVGMTIPKKLFISIGSNDLVLLKSTPKEVIENVVNQIQQVLMLQSFLIYQHLNLQ